MIPFEIFKSVEICAHVHRFLFEFSNFIDMYCTSVCIYRYTGHSIHRSTVYVSYDPPARQIFDGVVSNADHQPVLVVDMVPPPGTGVLVTTQENFKCVYPVWPVWVC